MEIADAQKFLQENHRACIAVRQKDGWPQMTLVTPGIDAEGRVIITSRGTTYKLKHLRRDPRRQQRERTGPQVLVDGECTIPYERDYRGGRADSPQRQRAMRPRWLTHEPVAREHTGKRGRDRRQGTEQAFRIPGAEYEMSTKYHTV